MGTRNLNILVVDDEDIKRITIRDDLREAGYPVQEAVSAEEGLAGLKEQPAEVVVTDLKMPGMDGMDFLRTIKTLAPETFVVVITGHGTLETAVTAIREGAYDYLTKPFSNQELLIILERIEELCRLKNENVSLRRQMQDNRDNPIIVGLSRTMQQLRQRAQRLAHNDSPMLLTGETGTGKDMFARAVHNLGPHRDQPFIKISCALYPVNILESELFGYEKGAFTGAAQARKGRFEAAGSGTVYLDEVDDIPLPLQVKLLHVLEDGVVERLGGSSPVPFTARVMAASKRDLTALVEAGEFRNDLFFRINVLSQHLPPLRELTEDIPYLITHFLYTFGYKADAISLTEAALTRLQAYSWPGNVRELRSIVEQLIFSSQKNITQTQITPLLMDNEPPTTVRPDGSLEEMISQYEKELIRTALLDCDGNISQAARQLNTKLSTFRDKVKKYGLND